jgi:hypothetical protein
MPSKWFKRDKFRYFNFDFFLSPIIDMAFVDGALLDAKGKVTDELTFNGDDFFFAGGLEAVVFPLAWRSIFLRISAAWNIKHLIESKTAPSFGNSEIYIGLDYQY